MFLFSMTTDKLEAKETRRAPPGSEGHFERNPAHPADQTKKRQSVLRCLGGTASAGSVSRRIKKKESSPYGPYFFVSLNS